MGLRCCVCQLKKGKQNDKRIVPLLKGKRVSRVKLVFQQRSEDFSYNFFSCVLQNLFCSFENFVNLCNCFISLHSLWNKHSFKGLKIFLKGKKGWKTLNVKSLRNFVKGITKSHFCVLLYSCSWDLVAHPPLIVPGQESVVFVAPKGCNFSQ